MARKKTPEPEERHIRQVTFLSRFNAERFVRQLKDRGYQAQLYPSTTVLTDVPARVAQDIAHSFGPATLDKITEIAA